MLASGFWECDTDIGANHNQAIVTVVERKSGYAVMAKVSNETADLVGAAIIKAFKPFEAKVKTQTLRQWQRVLRAREDCLIAG